MRRLQRVDATKKRKIKAKTVSVPAREWRSMRGELAWLRSMDAKVSARFEGLSRLLQRLTDANEAWAALFARVLSGLAGDHATRIAEYAKDVEIFNQANVRVREENIAMKAHIEKLEA